MFTCNVSVIQRSATIKKIQEMLRDVKHSSIENVIYSNYLENFWISRTRMKIENAIIINGILFKIWFFVVISHENY